MTDGDESSGDGGVGDGGDNGEDSGDRVDADDDRGGSSGDGEAMLAMR